MDALILVAWAFWGAAAVVGIAVLVLLGAAGREALRIVKRISALADHPILSDIERADAAIVRIEADLDALPVLRSRADAALAAIRHPRIAVLERMSAEIRQFRSALGG